MGSEHIGPRLKDLRLRRGMTGEKLADVSGYNQSYISEIENGKKTPPVRTLEKFADIFNVPVSYFTDEKNVSPLDVIYTPEEKEFLLAEENKGYIELAKDFKDSDLTPVEIRQIRETIRILRKGNK